MRRTSRLLLGLALLGGCGDPTAIGTTTTLTPQDAALIKAPAAENMDLAALRATLAPLHRFDAAWNAGWNNQFPAGCFSSSTGAMGMHYLNGENVGTLEPTKPQLLLFEPQKDGSQRLVGVEYIVPGDPSDTPPVLFNQPFAYNYQFSVWALHVWALESNPNGIYNNWNPKVTCDYAPIQAATSHH
jgi:hypothetical protein